MKISTFLKKNGGMRLKLSSAPLKNSATYFNINEANLMILRHETCTVQDDNVYTDVQ